MDSYCIHCTEFNCGEGQSSLTMLVFFFFSPTDNMRDSVMMIFMLFSFSVFSHTCVLLILKNVVYHSKPLTLV